MRIIEDVMTLKTSAPTYYVNTARRYGLGCQPQWRTVRPGVWLNDD